MESEIDTSMTNRMGQGSRISKFIKSLTFKEITSGIVLGLWYSRIHLFQSYVVIPVGLIIISMVLYGINQFIKQILKINFPASVLGMLINLAFLCILNVLATRKFNHQWLKTLSKACDFLFTWYLTLIRAPMNFTLKWINVFFIPSFVILPLSDRITFVECVKIAAVFVIGGLGLFLIDVYMMVALQWGLRSMGFMKSYQTDAQKSITESEDADSISVDHTGGVFTTMRDDITTIELTTFKTSPENHLKEFSTNIPLYKSEDYHIPNTQQPEPAYLGSQSGITITSVEKSFNAGTSNSQGLMKISSEPIIPTTMSLQSPINTSPETNSNVTMSSSMNTSSSSSSSSASNTTPRALNITTASPQPRQIVVPEDLSPNTQKIIIFFTKYVDWLLYFTLFIVSLPLYYIESIHTFLPYHLSITVLAYYAALLIPQRWPQLKKIAHPILISVGEILLVCLIGSLIYHAGKPKGFIQDLKYYKTGKNYLNLFNGQELAESSKIIGGVPGDKTGTPQWPGCGDFLSSLMDISIVSLSLPMFTHRIDFIRNFWVIMPATLTSMALTYFCYPLVCYHIGISAANSIGFIGRSVTLALGTPLITALNGSVSLMACCTIMSGICGVLIGDSLFKLLRVKPNDYVTRGVTLGINCGAIATAHLLNTDPRAASMSSLSFSIFGTIMIVLSSINAVKDLINSWVGL